jgi:hypothetical protein
MKRLKLMSAAVTAAVVHTSFLRPQNEKKEFLLIYLLLVG